MMASLNVSVDFVVGLEQITIESAQCLGCSGLKEKQLEAIASFLQGNDTFVPLPTGMASHLFKQFCHIRLTG